MSGTASAWCHGAAGIFIIAGLLTAPAPAARAQTISPELEARLSPAQQRAYVLHLRARAQFDAQLDAYWEEVEEKRAERRRRRAAGQRFTAAHYVMQQPPKYSGPGIPPDVAKIIAELKRPEEPEAEPRAGLADFLAHARMHYGFVPTPTSEREFKRRYAEEALAAGLSKMQVVRVYALETGGRGTYDMQAGIDPDTKQGKPISSALGYAQLLCGNSINELVKHGPSFIARLNAMAARPGTDPRRAAALRAKAAVVGKMLRVARSVPNDWGRQVKLGSTPRGMGIHALNLDADVGPWLQVIKLKGLLETAAAAGRPQLSGAELELMNLAGPRTGLDMMEPVARDVPTANFFSRTGYYRNTIVRERTSAELLAALDERMEANLKKQGSLDFIGIFDEVARERRAAAR